MEYLFSVDYNLSWPERKQQFAKTLGRGSSKGSHWTRKLRNKGCWARLSAALPAWIPTLNERQRHSREPGPGGLGKAVGWGNLFTRLRKLMTCVPGTLGGGAEGSALLDVCSLLSPNKVNSNFTFKSIILATTYILSVLIWEMPHGKKTRPIFR